MLGTMRRHDCPPTFRKVLQGPQASQGPPKKLDMFNFSREKMEKDISPGKSHLYDNQGLNINFFLDEICYLRTTVLG